MNYIKKRDLNAIQSTLGYAKTTEEAITKLRKDPSLVACFVDNDLIYTTRLYAKKIRSKFPLVQTYTISYALTEEHVSDTLLVKTIDPVVKHPACEMSSYRRYLFSHFKVVTSKKGLLYIRTFSPSGASGTSDEKIQRRISVVSKPFYKKRINYITYCNLHDKIIHDFVSDEVLSKKEYIKINDILLRNFGCKKCKLHNSIDIYIRVKNAFSYDPEIKLEKDNNYYFYNHLGNKVLCVKGREILTIYNGYHFIPLRNCVYELPRHYHHRRNFIKNKKFLLGTLLYPISIEQFSETFQKKNQFVYNSYL